MTCLKQVKYYLLVIAISLFMSGYFTLSYFMVTNIFKDSQNSLTTFNTVGNRGPYLDSLLTYFLQSVSRNNEIYVQPFNGSSAYLDSIDYFYNLTQNNQNEYNLLRRTLPSEIAGSTYLIEGLESQSMCNFLIQIEASNQGGTSGLIDQC